MLPNMAVGRSLLAGITHVEIEVDIDELGRVRAARPLSTGQDLSYPLMAAVVSAAEQWVFVPAQKGGRNIPSRHTIVFRFTGS